MAKLSRTVVGWFKNQVKERALCWCCGLLLKLGERVESHLLGCRYRQFVHIRFNWLDYILAHVIIITSGLRDKSGQSNEERDAGQEGCRKGEEVWGLVIGDMGRHFYCALWFYDYEHNFWSLW